MAIATDPTVSSANAATTESLNQPPTAAAAESAAAVSVLAEAHDLVRRNVLWAMGVGLVPLPLVDFVGVAAVQVKMLSELSTLYKQKFSEQAARKVIAALAAGLGTAGLGGALATALFKFIPIVGTSLAVLSLPLVAGAFTMATGRVFVSHFESGGTVLTFDPKAIRAHFRAEFEQARQEVARMKPANAQR